MFTKGSKSAESTRTILLSSLSRITLIDTVWDNSAQSSPRGPTRSDFFGTTWRGRMLCSASCSSSTPLSPLSEMSTDMLLSLNEGTWFTESICMVRFFVTTVVTFAAPSVLVKATDRLAIPQASSLIRNIRLPWYETSGITWKYAKSPAVTGNTSIFKLASGFVSRCMETFTKCCTIPPTTPSLQRNGLVANSSKGNFWRALITICTRCVSDVSMPPFCLPPSSCSVTLKNAIPL